MEEEKTQENTQKKKEEETESKKENTVEAKSEVERLEFTETTPLNIILEDLNKKLTDKNNKNKSLEHIINIKKKDDNNGEKIRHNNTKFNNAVFLVLGLIFVIINLVGIFTIRSIMNSLFEILKKSLKYFLWKKSNLEEYELTDIENRYNSQYNFYEQYFNDISKNEVDFDLIMFWDFLGSFFYDYFSYTCTSIFFLIVNSIILAFIGGFDFLDLDIKTHKYTFFQIIYILLVYLFLWIGVGCSSLLSHQIFIDSFEKLKKNNYFKKKNENSSKNEEQNEDQNETENKTIQIDKNNLNKQQDENKENKENINDKFSENSDEIEYEYFSMIFITSIAAFIINYFVNRKILKFRNEYIAKQLRKPDKERAYNNIYSRDKILFLLTICLPYFSEIVLSLLFYSFFYHIIFKEVKKQKQTKNNENSLEEENIGLNADNYGYKKLCGYVFFKETIKEKKETSSYEETCYCCKSLINCCCCEYIIMIIISFRDCFLNIFNNENYNCNCCYCKCCKDYSCCCCDVRTFQKKETDFGLCYQEKRCSIWFYNYVNSDAQRALIPFIFCFAFYQFLTIGLEEIYDEKNENNIEQENIFFQLLYSCIIFIGASFFISFLLLPISENYFWETVEANKCIDSNNKSNKDIFKKLTFSLFFGAGIFIIPSNSISSFYFSIKYLKDESSLYNDKGIYYPIFFNKYFIFIISCIILNQNQKKNKEIELISNSFLVSIYLFILELIISGIKKISSIKALIIIQIICSSLIILVLGLSILFLLCTLICVVILRRLIFGENMDKKDSKSDIK